MPSRILITSENSRQSAFPTTTKLFNVLKPKELSGIFETVYSKVDGSIQLLHKIFYSLVWCTILT
jgi:hypothetical protein